MRRLFVIIGILCAHNLYAQINFKSANSENGIIFSSKDYEIGGIGMNLGYDFSKSEARFTYASKIKSKKADFYLRMKDGKKILLSPNFDPSTIDITQISDTIPILPFKTNNFKFTIPISDGTNAIYSGGTYNPGLGVAYEFVKSKDQFAEIAKYGFIRLGYEVQQNKFGRITTTDSIDVEKKVTHNFNITPGYNWVLSTIDNTDNLIVAVSMALQYNVNPITDMKTKDFVIIDSLASNGTIQKTEKAYPKFQDDNFSVLPKLDIAWTPFLQTNSKGEEKGPRIGFLGSISTKYNINENKMAWNLSFGPSIHPKWSSSNIISSLQFEFIDFNDSTGEKDIDDIFSINFYVGIPIQLK